MLTNTNYLSKWMTETNHSNFRHIDKKFTHKNIETNSLVGRIEKVDSAPDTYISQAIVSTEHPFFFEHEVDHIPGLFIIEYARQVSMACSHLFLDVPLSSVFIMDRLDTQFIAIPDTEKPLFAIISRDNIKLKQGRVAKQDWKIEIVQNSKLIASLIGGQTILPKALFSRLRHSS